MSAQLVSLSSSLADYQGDHHRSAAGQLDCATASVAEEHSSVAAKRLATTRPFTQFGCWGETIRVVRAGAEPLLIRWMALHDRESTYDARWAKCQQALPECFLEYRIVEMRRPSFFLPAGEVVFKVMVNPTQIPDSPPLGVSMRHMEALDAFPQATFYFLRPVFTADPVPRMYTAADLRHEAAADRENIIAATRLHGWAIRSVQWTRRRMAAAARLGLRGGTRLLEAFRYLLLPVGRRRLVRLANGAVALQRHRDLDVLADRADELGLGWEAREFRRAAKRLQGTFDFDPVLCFEVASRPGRLWFEAHWYLGQDGRTYVHY